MFKKEKKLNLQELEREFNIQTMRLGDITLQIERLNKARVRCLQLLEDLNKKGISLKEKIGEEVAKKVEEGKNEVH